MPVEFILFAVTLIGVALLHRHTLAVALIGVAAITLYKLAVTGFAALEQHPAINAAIDQAETLAQKLDSEVCVSAIAGRDVVLVAQPRSIIRRALGRVHV